MASNRNVIFTDRDRELLAPLARTPLTATQLLSLSETFGQPFSADRPLRRRMQLLCSAGWARAFRYASFGGGASNYYKLTPIGYRLLNGPRAPLPARGFFGPVSLSLQEHTQALADFIVCSTIAAARGDVPMMSFYRENELHLSLGPERLQPDCAFQLDAGALRLNYLVELDNGTEPIYSRKERDSLARKISFYDRYQESCSERFRVLTIFTKPGARLETFLATAERLVTNPYRRLFYAVHLADYCGHCDPLHAPLFRDHHSKRQPLVPVLTHPRVPARRPVVLDSALVPC